MRAAIAPSMMATEPCSYIRCLGQQGCVEGKPLLLKCSLDQRDLRSSPRTRASRKRRLSSGDCRIRIGALRIRPEALLRRVLLPAIPFPASQPRPTLRCPKLSSAVACLLGGRKEPQYGQSIMEDVHGSRPQRPQSGLNKISAGTHQFRMTEGIIGPIRKWLIAQR